MKYEITIGIECHVQLKTKTKLFSEVDNDARGKSPNSCVSPVDYALPGMLPRLNKEAIHLAVLAGFALNSEINLESRFDRKHYYYPDLPKGYQITQLYHPIIGAGYVALPDGEKVRIEHAHLEEDAGKLSHFGSYSLVDLNRAGTPLIEIVSMPDIHSAKAAHDYCKELWRIMTFAGVTYGDLYNGNMRFDINISLAKPGAKQLGTRAEIKNLNSFRSVERAVEYEYSRQSKLLDHGEKVVQETRGWSDVSGKTTSQRSKEEAQDYRYMPEPDIPPIRLTKEYVDNIKQELVLLPENYRKKFSGKIPSDIVEILLDYPQLVQKLSGISEKYLKTVANLFASVLLAEENSSLLNDELPSEKQLEDLCEMKEKGELSSTNTKEVFLKFFDPEMHYKDTRAIAKELNVIQENDSGELEKIVDEVLGKPETQQAQADYRAGSEKVIGFLVGQVMKASRGKANPSAVQEILKEKLK
ncbi:MAG: Asp-tRNA(Asn)/Glu-tRNA(Gln) amidotransferase subunit GatB [Candidatus Saccharibacteria bacterium]|nr:Asp-tRNA(Asn)/Glu-tRNA(Gln) amidotransferase subunit GatB [Candidatus Saccharibacteria bacterium]